MVAKRAVLEVHNLNIFHSKFLLGAVDKSYMEFAP
jgi:hypothetical protein